MITAIIAFFVCIIATTLGGITGLGGGVMIKPIMDAVAPSIPPATLNFLSGCTVLAMALVSYLRGRGTEININKKTLFLIAGGGALGGVLGSFAFDYVRLAFEDESMIKVIQNAILVVLILVIFVYLKNQKSIYTKHISNPVGSAAIGLALGISSAFLGIGGGPINLVALYYFFSMRPKVAAYCSIFIILMSQGTSFVTTAITGIPQFDILMMVLMVTGGIAGGFIGRFLDKYIDDDATSKIFTYLMIAIMLISLYNIVSTIWF